MDIVANLSGTRIAIDNYGDIYITGGTTSSNIFPVKNAYQSTCAGESDAFVAKFTSSGTLVFDTYLGGKDTDYGTGVATDNNGNVYIVGITSSPDFPVKNAYQPTYAGFHNNVFVAKFTASGALVFSTYLGGDIDQSGNAIAVDRYGNSYITGTTSSPDFPVKNAYQSSYQGYYEIFVTKFTASGALAFSTFLGGSTYLGGSKNLGRDEDQGKGVAVDSNGNVYVTGLTYANSFPLKNAYQSTYTGESNANAFVTKFTSSGKLVFSTYLGGSGQDIGNGIAVDKYGNCYITGETFSSDFPIKNAYNSRYGGNGDVFVAKFTTSGTLAFSTYLGGSNEDAGTEIAVDNIGNSYIIGYTYSENFFIKNMTQNAYQPFYATFLTKFTTSGVLIFKSDLGGGTYSITVDRNGNCYITGSNSIIEISAILTNFSLLEKVILVLLAISVPISIIIWPEPSTFDHSKKEQSNESADDNKNKKNETFHKQDSNIGYYTKSEVSTKMISNKDTITPVTQIETIIVESYQAPDYETAVKIQQRGFPDYTTYKRAIDKGILTYTEWIKYQKEHS